MRKHLLIVFIILLVTGKIAAQNITGTVVDEQNVPIPGVTVVVKGATTGTVTDIDGKFELNVPDASTKTLVFTFLGYKNQEQAIGRNTNFTITMKEDVQHLEDVVVIGYGTQQKKLVTGAISSVNAQDIAKIPNDGRVEVALQGRTPGVIVGPHSGQPGTNDVTVRIRGVSSFLSGNDPLWVVDGIIVQSSNLNYLNQADIQSIEVLKDAASAAIYGTRAGNGVILVTTKKGSEGNIKMNYNGYVGTQAPTRLMPMANATQYATLMNEQAIADGAAKLPYPDPSSLGEGTNWQKQVFSNNALRTNHDISISGGNKTSNIYASLGYQKQDGIVLPQVSGFEKYSARINHNEQFLKIFKFGQSVTYTRNQSKSVGTNTEFGEALSNAIQLDPLTPVYISPDEASKLIQYQASPYNIVAPNGMLYGISNVVTQEVVNPLGYAQIREGNRGYSDNFIANSYLEIDPIAGLSILTKIGFNRNYWGDQSFTPKYYQTGIRAQQYTSLYRHNGVGTEWNWDNTITYSKKIKDHSFDIMLGHAINEDGIGGETWITYKNLPVNNYKDANFNWTTDNGATDRTGSTNDYVRHRVVSLFGRLSYNYAQKYLATITARHDGSTRFGANNRWATFPAVSLGWVTSSESFWTNNISSDAMDYFKIRGGYGVTGNDNYGNFHYLSTISSGNNYVIGTTGSTTAGNSPTTLANPNLKWEQTTQTNIGFDARFLKNFNFSFDYYTKNTTGALEPLTLPQYVGVPNAPWANMGNIDNSGIELQLGYDKQAGNWTFGAIANFATLKNRVSYIAVSTPYALFNEPTYQNLNNNVGNLTREVVGYPVHGFWGYKTNGVFQNAADVQNYKSSDGTIIQPNAKPGDFRWTDVNDDGVINASDVTYLGSSLPTYTYGLTLNAEYGNKSMGSFDFMVFFQGQGGNKIFQDYRRFDAGAVNFPAYYMNRWTGEGTTNSFPRLATFGMGDKSNANFNNMSDFYLHDGAFLRVKNVQLGYNLPARISRAISSDKIRIYVAVENLATFTKYNGFDPEIGGGDVFSIDKGYYPQSRTFMVGLNLQF